MSGIEMMIASSYSMYSIKTSYNLLSHTHWGLGQFVGGWEGWSPLKFRLEVVKKKSPDFRSPEVGISV